jgi:hypothetical protein
MQNYATKDVCVASWRSATTCAPKQAGAKTHFAVLCCIN